MHARRITRCVHVLSVFAATALSCAAVQMRPPTTASNANVPSCRSHVTESYTRRSETEHSQSLVVVCHLKAEGKAPHRRTIAPIAASVHSLAQKRAGTHVASIPIRIGTWPFPVSTSALCYCPNQTGRGSLLRRKSGERVRPNVRNKGPVGGYSMARLLSAKDGKGRNSKQLLARPHHPCYAPCP